MRNSLSAGGFSQLLPGAQLLAAEPEGTPGQWNLVSTSDNVVLYRRSRPGPGHYESKAVGEIAASTAVVHAVLDDVDSYSRFMPYTVECRVLKREGRFGADVSKDLRSARQRSRLHVADSNDFKEERGRHQLSQPMGNGERTWPCRKAGNHPGEIMRRRLAARTGGSKCNARDLLGLYRQRRSDPRFHQEHRKPDGDPKDFRGSSQTSARAKVRERGKVDRINRDCSREFPVFSQSSNPVNPV